MQSLLDLNLLVDKYAALLPELDLDGDDQEEYSTMLLQLQNQIEGGTPNEIYVERCLAWLAIREQRRSFKRVPPDRSVLGDLNETIL